MEDRSARFKSNTVNFPRGLAYFDTSGQEIDPSVKIGQTNLFSGGFSRVKWNNNPSIAEIDGI